MSSPAGHEVNTISFDPDGTRVGDAEMENTRNSMEMDVDSQEEIERGAPWNTQGVAMTSETNPSPEMASSKWVFAFGGYLVLFSLVMLYLLAKLWPGKLPLPPDDHSTVKLLPGILEVPVWVETRYLLLVAITGALGSYIHLATSFADYLGNRQFVKSWAWWYVLRPFIGMALSVMVYFAARGGLVAGSSGADALSPYGVAALAGLAGMFSKQATDKLREVFENLFKTDPAKQPQRADTLKHADAAQQNSQPQVKA
jgi:hypothetical protein